MCIQRQVPPWCPWPKARHARPRPRWSAYPQPSIPGKMCQVFHLKVGSPWIVPASVSTLPTFDVIRHFRCHNSFLWLHNFLQPNADSSAVLDRAQQRLLTTQRYSSANPVTSGLEAP